jgi:hypothetical protein
VLICSERASSCEQSIEICSAPYSAPCPAPCPCSGWLCRDSGAPMHPMHLLHGSATYKVTEPLARASRPLMERVVSVLREPSSLPPGFFIHL